MQDVHVVPSETLQLKKQDSEISASDSMSDILDICKLQVTFVGNIQECKELMTPSNRNSVDLDPRVEQVQINRQMSEPDVVQTRAVEEKDIRINIDNPD